MAGKFEIKKSKSKRFIFNLKAGNGEIILSSQLYVEKAGCSGVIETVRKASFKDSNYQRREATDGSPYFVLKSSNGRVMGKSELYKSKASRENGIKSVMKNAPDGRVVDMTDND